MDLVTKVILLSLFSFTLAMAAAPHVQKKDSEKDVLMRCLYIPSSVQAASTTPPQSSAAAASETNAQSGAADKNMGFKFSFEKNNGNEMAVDVYALNDDKKPIKQIGHGDVVGSVVTGSSELAVADDSPFNFHITVNRAEGASQATAIVNTMTTFDGEIHTALRLNCQFPAAQNSASETPVEKMN